MATHEFQEAFKNYRDLLFLARNLQQWQESLGVLRDMLANRRQAFAERLPQVREKETRAEPRRLRAAMSRRCGPNWSASSATPTRRHSPHRASASCRRRLDRVRETLGARRQRSRTRAGARALPARRRRIALAAERSVRRATVEREEGHAGTAAQPGAGAAARCRARGGAARRARAARCICRPHRCAGGARRRDDSARGGTDAGAAGAQCRSWRWPNCCGRRSAWPRTARRRALRSRRSYDRASYGEGGRPCGHAVDPSSAFARRRCRGRAARGVLQLRASGSGTPEPPTLKIARVAPGHGQARRRRQGQRGGRGARLSRLPRRFAARTAAAGSAAPARRPRNGHGRHPHGDRRPTGATADYKAAIARYQEFLKTYPNDSGNDRVLYQLARAYELSGELETSLTTLDRLVLLYPDDTLSRRGAVPPRRDDVRAARLPEGGSGVPGDDAAATRARRSTSGRSTCTAGRCSSRGGSRIRCSRSSACST